PELISNKLLSLCGTREKLFKARCPLLSKNSRNIFLSWFTPYGCILKILLFRSKSLFYNISQQGIFVKRTIGQRKTIPSVRSARYRGQLTAKPPAVRCPANVHSCMAAACRAYSRKNRAPHQNCVPCVFLFLIICA